MRSLLSISAAGASHGTCEALWTQGASYSFGELAEQSAALRLPERNLHRGSNTLQTALLLYKSLEEGRALCLLPAGASDQEFASYAEQVPQELPKDTALLLFTSGGGGRPKGVKLSRDALIASAQASEQRLKWFGWDRWLCALPLSHIGGLSVLLRCLVARKTAYLCERFDTAKVATAIESQKITHISLVPTMLWRLLEAGFCAPQHLQVTLMGGAALDSDLAARASAAGFRLRKSYGMTETASQIVTDGRALDGAELRVHEGQLEIKGPMLMQGYLPPDQPSELGPGAWFRTQDRATIDDQGTVTILGRADEVIITGGENIDPRVVEAGLNQSPSISTSFALGLPHPEWGQELVALVVATGPEVSEKELQAHTLQGHARPKMLIAVEALPCLENGKIDRAQARRLAQEARDS